MPRCSLLADTTRKWHCLAALLLSAACAPIGVTLAQEPVGSNAPDVSRNADDLGQQYLSEIRPLVQRFCFDCHAQEVAEADVDLSAFATMDQIRSDARVWQTVRQMLDSRQMPPQDAPQPSDAEFEQMQEWVRAFLTDEAAARDGDPGPVVLRRLSNDEYTYTLRDLTGIDTLDPAREFPVDGAAGEGFTNTGSGLVMSPALVIKYLDAAKKVAEHLVLLPDGIGFSPHTTRRDWTNAQLERIRAFYAQFSDARGGSAVNLQGIKFDTNSGGRLPLERYLQATLEQRAALWASETDIAQVAEQQQLNPQYLELLWQTLTDADVSTGTVLVNELRRRWRRAEVSQLPQLLSFLHAWQSVLWKFNAIGQIGREGGPPAWQEPVSPLISRQDFRIPLPQVPPDSEIVVRLAVGDAGDGSAHDIVIWENPRIERPGQPAISLRDARAVQHQLEKRRRAALEDTTRYLKVVSELEPEEDPAVRARAEQLDPAVVSAWRRILGLEPGGPATITGHFTETMKRSGGYDFINGWGSPQTPSISANSSDQIVRIPGIARPRSVVVHPSPTDFVAVGWRSPITGTVEVQANVADAHPECGNGVEWSLLHYSGQNVETLADGSFEVAGSASIHSQLIEVRQGEVLSIAIGPSDGNHSCDLTEIRYLVTETGKDQRVWNLATDVSADILAANPHADSYGTPEVWHFYQGNMASLSEQAKPSTGIPPGSLLAQWKDADGNEVQAELAKQIQALLTGDPPPFPDSPDGLLYRVARELVTPAYDLQQLGQTEIDERFGSRWGSPAGARDIVSQAPQVLEFHVPGELGSEGELVVGGSLAPDLGREGSVQLQVVVASEPTLDLKPDLPIVVAPQSVARDRWVRELSDFRQLFPIALCYQQIVPVDEVVTLQLFYREDELFKQLMLDAHQSAVLDRLWEELLYVSQEPIALTVAFEQLSEFATQDRPDIVVALEPLRQPLNERADRFREQLLTDQPRQVDALVQFAARAWRRDLTENDQASLRSLYQQLRDSELSHEDALRLTLARILTSPTFLYRLENPGEGTASTPVSNTELASRLSYFLWSTAPDDELAHAARSGELDARDVLLKQTTRMLGDDKSRRLAIHFACQWLGIRGFDEHDDKNERLYPGFAGIRADMYEESIRFFEDMIQQDGSVLDLLDADHTFVNADLAAYYGIASVTQDHWQRVEGLQAIGRGGVLGMGTVLSTQSGASRTSPILRGNWVYETLLGKRLPRPPADVPQLPEQLPKGLSARQLIELHSSAPECAKCHERIDPFGFALEQFDAVGKLRSESADTRTRLPDGQEINGLAGLRQHLLTEQRDAVLHQFCRKLLGYALGRGIQLSDEPLLTRMKQELQANDHRFSAAVKSIVLSRQFREIRGREADVTAANAHR